MNPKWHYLVTDEQIKHSTNNTRIEVYGAQITAQASPCDFAFWRRLQRPQLQHWSEEKNAFHMKI